MKRVAHFHQDIDAFIARDLPSFLEVQPGAEHAAIGRGKNGHADTVIGFDCLPGIGQPVRCCDRQRVLALGPVYANRCNPVFNRHIDGVHQPRLF